MKDLRMVRQGCQVAKDGLLAYRVNLVDYAPMYTSLLLLSSIIYIEAERFEKLVPEITGYFNVIYLMMRR